MPWRVFVTARAQKEIDRMPAGDRDALLSALQRLADDPSSVDVKKLGGRGNEWRLRIGRWRVILDVDNQSGQMTVKRVAPRDRAY